MKNLRQPNSPLSIINYPLEKILILNSQFLIILALLSSCQKHQVALQLDANPSKRMEYAAQQLEAALEKHGYDVEYTTAATTIANDDIKTITLSQANSDTLPKEGFTIETRGNHITINGNDPSGVIYGAREIIDRMEISGKLNTPQHLVDAPEMRLRGACVGVQKTHILPGRAVYEYPYTPENFPWFYDKQLWIEYLDMLVENRMNSLYLWNGHPFASLVKLKDYPYAIEVDDETFKKNEDIYTFLTEEADKRGIFVIQMFYNILVSQPFAQHHGIKTQDRNRPITPLLSDYTRKSVAAFVEKYSNVGLLVCLGEAIDTYEDDVRWFTETILPGVKDGLKAIGRTDEPPVLLRAHDTNCKMVMDAALPIYKNLYTMHKYNGESLTTYQPGGPWGDIHKSLSSLGSTHISNVHILANLEPFRWASPDFIQKTVKAMHDIHGANALHLYPQASYWDWPYTADSITEGRLRQIDRDWAWYKLWGRYSWNCRRDRQEEIAYWDKTYANFYGLSPNEGANIREAFEESGEIAPKLLRRFGITEGNRQTLLLGMFVSQLVNPYKYTIYPGFYESCGPQGEKLIEYVEKEWKHQTHTGELPLDIISQCINHGDKAATAIDQLEGKPTQNKEEFERLRNDIHCYREFAYFFNYKVKAAQQVLNYQWSKQLHHLDSVAPLLEKSLQHYRNLVDRTKAHYLYANSMQTTMRRIPIAGDDGKNKTWAEMLPHYEKELDNFRNNLNTLKEKQSGKNIEDKNTITPANDATIKLEGNWQKVKLTTGATLLSNRKENKIKALAPELEGLTAFTINGDKQRQEGTTITFSCETPVKLLVGYFKDDQKRYAKPPKLETDASANEYGQAEPLLTNAIHLDKMPLANIHAYHFTPGHHTLNLPKGYTLILGFTNSNIKPRNAALEGTDDAMDWLFY